MIDNTCIRCGRTIPEGRHVCRSCEIEGQKMGLLNKPAVRTNGDKVRQMTDEQLIPLIMNYVCDNRGDCPSQNMNCRECVKEWLESEAVT